MSAISLLDVAVVTRTSIPDPMGVYYIVLTSALIWVIRKFLLPPSTSDTLGNLISLNHCSTSMVLYNGIIYRSGGRQWHEGVSAKPYLQKPPSLFLRTMAQIHSRWSPIYRPHYFWKDQQHTVLHWADTFSSAEATDHHIIGSGFSWA